MASKAVEDVVSVLETDVVQVLVVAGTAFGTALATIPSNNYTEAGIIAAATAAIQVTLKHFFPSADAAKK